MCCSVSYSYVASNCLVYIVELHIMCHCFIGVQLLEHALAVEEQLHRASSLGLMQDPNQSVMMLHSR